MTVTVPGRVAGPYGLGTLLKAGVEVGRVHYDHARDPMIVPLRALLLAEEGESDAALVLRYNRTHEARRSAPAAADEHDAVNHPAHYTRFPGVEVIQITEHLNFCRGNAVKYLCRAGAKGDELEDLRKAAWYVQREIERVERGSHDSETGEQ